MSYLSIDWNGLLRDAGHRPWPLLEKRWAMRMSWNKLLFAHWQVDAESLRRKLPEGLELDLFEGKAWVGIVPFVMENVGVRHWPTPAPWARFCELNVRAYVTANGRPGVWFFSLDAASRGAVEGARATFNLPYFKADMSCQVDGERTSYSSRRTDKRSGPGVFRATWEAASDVRQTAVGSLEHWLTERYCLYSAGRRGRLYSADIHHPIWPLRDAQAEILENSVCDAHGLQLQGGKDAPLLHCVDGIDVVGWWVRRCRS